MVRRKMECISRVLARAKTVYSPDGEAWENTLCACRVPPCAAVCPRSMLQPLVTCYVCRHGAGTTAETRELGDHVAPPRPDTVTHEDAGREHAR